MRLLVWAFFCVLEASLFSKYNDNFLLLQSSPSHSECTFNAKNIAAMFSPAGIQPPHTHTKRWGAYSSEFPLCRTHKLRTNGERFQFCCFLLFSQFPRLVVPSSLTQANVTDDVFKDIFIVVVAIYIYVKYFFFHAHILGGDILFNRDDVVTCFVVFYMLRVVLRVWFFFFYAHDMVDLGE